MRRGGTFRTGSLGDGVALGWGCGGGAGGWRRAVREEVSGITGPDLGCGVVESDVAVEYGRSVLSSLWRRQRVYVAYGRVWKCIYADESDGGLHSCRLKLKPEHIIVHFSYTSRQSTCVRDL